MRLLEVQDGISIDVDKIESIEKINDTSCKIRMATGTYVATFSYETILQLLNAGNVIGKEKADFSKVMKKLDGVLGTMGNFAG